jgi:hypothetical protein
MNSALLQLGVRHGADSPRKCNLSLSFWGSLTNATTLAGCRDIVLWFVDLDIYFVDLNVWKVKEGPGNGLLSNTADSIGRVTAGSWFLNRKPKRERRPVEPCRGVPRREAHATKVSRSMTGSYLFWIISTASVHLKVGESPGFCP